MTAFGKPGAPPESDFIQLNDLFDRLLLIEPTAVTVVPSTQKDKDGNVKPDYRRITANVVVLDGRPKIGGKTVTIPHVINDMWISGAKIVPQLEEYLNNAETPYALGRLVNGEVNSYGNAPKVLEPYDEDDAKVATEYLQSIQPEL